MLKVTLEGPIGSGKTRIADCIAIYCEIEELTCLRAVDATPEVIKQLNPDVLIIENLTPSDGQEPQTTETQRKTPVPPSQG